MRWCLGDPAGVDRLLHELTPSRQRQLTETLAALFESGGTATEAAALLGVHPQTVRYRVRQLQQILGHRFTDPDGQFALELTVQALRVRERYPGTALPGP